MNKVAVVSGANQGLGFALVRRLCQQLGGTGTVYLTARDPSRGMTALKQLRTDGLSPHFHPLDVTDDESVTRLGTFLRDQHGGVDIVISNAAARLGPNLAQAQQVRSFVDTNNHGTQRMIRALVPLLKDGGRFVVVASSFGSLRLLPRRLHHHFDVVHLSLRGVEAAMEDYVRLVESGRATHAGWPEWVNVASKIGQVAATKVTARRRLEEAERRDLMIVAACPGLVDTDASRPWFADMSQAQSPDEAAEDVVWLATLPQRIPALYGELVQHRRIIPFNPVHERNALSRTNF